MLERDLLALSLWLLGFGLFVLGLFSLATSGRWPSTLEDEKERVQSGVIDQE